LSGQYHAPADLPPGKARYTLYRGLGGPASRSGRVRKIPPPQIGIRFPDRAAHSEEPPETLTTLPRKHSGSTFLNINQLRCINTVCLCFVTSQRPHCLRRGVAATRAECFVLAGRSTDHLVEVEVSTWTDRSPVHNSPPSVIRCSD
jgi:hypothetical protein